MDVTALRARVAVLEAENAALAAAGEEATELAEHYARAQGRARRRARADAALERALREQLAVAVAHRAPACACAGADAGEPRELHDALVRIVQLAAPAAAADDVRKVLAVHAAMRYLRDAQAAAAAGGRTLDVDAELISKARNALLLARDVVYTRQLDALARQLRCFVAALRDVDVQGEALALHGVLLHAAADAVCAACKEAKRSPLPPLCSTNAALAEQLCDVVKRRIHPPAPAPAHVSTPANSTLPPTPAPAVRNDADADAETLAKLRAQVDDERARAAVFECKLKGAHRAEAAAEELRVQLAEMRAALDEARAETVQVREEAARKEALKAPRAAAQAYDAARIHVADVHARQVRALNTRYARLLVADLAVPNDEDDDNAAVALGAHHRRQRYRAARKRAACARVVRLDATTLRAV